MTIAKNLGLLAPQVSSSGTISYNSLTNLPQVISLKCTSLVYPGNDLAADTAGGQTISIIGTGFEATPTVYVGGTIASSVTFVSSTQINFVAPAKTAGTYDIYVVNPGGATAIFVFGISYSGVPSWTTAAGSLGTFDSALNIQLQATSNSAVSYALATGSTLPTGITLSSGGLLSGTATDQTFSFTVVATDLENQDTSRSFQVTINISDPYFKYVTLLLTGNGTSGATNKNNVFVDNSTNNFAITAAGDATQGTFSPYGSNWSNYFDTSGDSLTVPYGSTLALGTGDCTIEAWVYLVSYPQQFNNIVDIRESSVSYSNNAISFSVENDGTFTFYAGSYSSATHVLETASGKVSLNTWTHLAVTRSSGTTKLYVNGVEEASSANAWNQTSGTATTLYIGNAVVARQINGYISNLRIVKGTAVYTSAFTPSTTPLTAITNTVLLTCQSNRFIDNSTNAFTITRNGDASVQRFSPFATPQYSASTLGGSGYFDGTGDYLNTPTTGQFAPAGDFTIAVWYYPTTLSTNNIVIANYTADLTTDWQINVTSTGSIEFYTNGNPIRISGGSVKAGAWNYIVLARSGSTLTGYLNGTSIGTYTQSGTFGSATKTIWVGSRPFSGSPLPITGYISDVKLIDGSAVTTVPTAPQTATTGTNLLLSFTNAAVTDSTLNHTVKLAGNVAPGTFTPYGSNWSNYFDGTGDYISAAYNSAFAMNTYATFECWVNFSSLSAVNRLIFGKDGFWLNYSYTGIGTTADKIGFSIYNGSSWTTVSSTTTPQVGQWIHIAGVRDNTTLRIYINGIQEATTSFSSSPVVSSYALSVGGNAADGAGVITGYISNARYCNGATSGALPYTGNFTPSTTPLSATASTVFLSCQSNRFIDNSTNAFAITVNGNVSVQRFSPFAPPAAYAASTDGGSGYFDGSGDYLTTPTSSQFTASGNFTVSCWFMLNSFANSYYVVGGNWDAGTSDEWLIQIQNNGAIRFLTSASTSFSSSGVVKLNEWTFFSATRSGSTVTVQVNGTTVSTYTKSDTLGSATKSINIGQQPGNNWPWNGYISDFRLVSGSAVTTLPTSPLTAISGTGLLLNFTNAGIIDNAEINNLETSGMVQVSTIQNKFGGASLYFDGTGGRVTALTNPALNLNGDYTIECWTYATSLPSYAMIFDTSTGTAGVNMTELWVRQTGAIEYYARGSILLSGTGIVANTWQHIALTRSGNTQRLFVNGNIVATATSSTAPNTGYNWYIGDRQASAPSGQYPFSGYIDDFRVTNGYARYTANFTPPTSAHKLK